MSSFPKFDYTTLRQRLGQLQRLAQKATDAKCSRTREKAASRIEHVLENWQKGGTRVLERELVILLRMACLHHSVRGGMASDQLPTDPVIVAKLATTALGTLPPPRAGRPRTSVNPRVIHEARGLDRKKLEKILEAEGLEPGEGGTAERTASRIREAGVYVETPLGAVAGIFPCSPKPPKGVMQPKPKSEQSEP